MNFSQATPATSFRHTLDILSDEGFRLFFPLAAIHAALWPFLWVAAFGLGLPFATAIPPDLWHAHEMLIGSFGAALIGFLTTAVPEWTDTERLHGRSLIVLAALWGTARVVGLVGAEALGLVGALCDVLWLALLVAYLIRVSHSKRTTRFIGLTLWISCLLVTETVTRYAFLNIATEADLAERTVHLTGFVFLAVLALALARITVPVTNLVLDPSQQTSPFRPHPGRMNLAPGLVGLLVAAEAAGFSEPTIGYLCIAAGAAFMDRVAESFIGREIIRAEILALAGSAALAGLGLILLGLSHLGFQLSEYAGLHVALMGGLGLGVLTVFSIAGLRHTGQALGFLRQTRLALLLLVAAMMLRVVPEIWPTEILPTAPYTLVALLWAAAFLLWLKVYWPFIRDPATFQHDGC
ncbi:NnrS family protein [Hyphomicrobium sp. LHD-15]|uniref:NnrS family protein n=1 Tax=Hyphomicrobium sp. LHD-15 TaxID=3072142 RepID=UPI00280EF21E|nr:NnrS family protein [Hyphomicrobium sp. LHD-15]MDQ8698245.1 NnrS family protein [Hyphomicrobium sp. LHD-15]